MMKISEALLITVSCVLVTARVSGGTVISGRVTVSSYAWDRSEIDTTNTRHFQNTGTLGLRLARIGGHDLEINTSLRGRFDFRNQGDNVHDYRVHNLYARFRKLAGRADLTVGRHWSNWPSGSVGIDGASAEVELLGCLSVGGYVGSLAPDDGRFKPTVYDDGHAFGARLGHRCRTFGTVYLVFAERRQRRAYGGNDLNTLSSRILGLDWRRPIPGFGQIYGQLLYDELRRQIGRMQFTARWDATPKIALQGEYRYRRPSISYNSIFWVFGDSEYSEGRLRLYWRASPAMSLFAGGALIGISGDDAQRFDLGVSHKYVSLMIHAKSGVPGNTVGVIGEAQYPISNLWTIRGGSNYSSYELIEDQAESSSQTAVWGGIRWQALGQAMVDLEAQFLSQDITTRTSFAGDESDFRVIARVSWWFFERLGKSGEKP